MRRKRLRKKDLGALAGISSASVTKLAQDRNVTTDVLCRVCAALKCSFGDIMEFVDDAVDRASSPKREKETNP
jgi:DNA-binding Xre family transcriptional regulator